MPNENSSTVEETNGKYQIVINFDPEIARQLVNGKKVVLQISRGRVKSVRFEKRSFASFKKARDKKLLEYYLKEIEGKNYK